jgi:hypothetical protein
MTTRTVTGSVVHPESSTPWVGALVRFRLSHPFTTLSGTYLVETITVTTNSDGDFSVDLAVPDTGTAEYICFLPDRSVFRFNLDAGPSIAIEELLDIAAVPQNVVDAAIAAHEVADEQHTFLHLRDTPDDYDGQADKVLGVNSGETGLTFLMVATEDALSVEETARIAADSAHAALTTTAHGGIVASSDARLSDARTPLTHEHPWSDVTGTPTTISGYGITDAFTQTLADARYRPIDYVPAWSEVTSTPTTISGYGITDLLAYKNADNQFSVAQGVRAAVSGVAAGLYVLWVSGDSLPTVKAGATTTGNTQTALYGLSDSGIGVRGYGATSAGVYAESDSGKALIARRGGATSNAFNEVAQIQITPASTPANGLGPAITFQADSSTTANRDQSRIGSIWTDVTDLTRTSAFVIHTLNSASLAERLRVTGAGQLLLRTTGTSTAAGFYAPWITGDTLPTLVVGASTSGNNQTAVTGISDTLTGVYGQSNSGSGVNGTSTSSAGVVANSTSSNAIVATNASASCIVATNSDTATNTQPFGFNLRHGTSATPVAGFGESLALQLHDAGNTYRTAGTMTAIWTDPLAVSFTSALTFATANAAGTQAERMRITGIGQLLLRSTDATQAAGGYIPWVSGDTLPTFKAGSSTSGNNQIAIQGISDSSTGVNGQSASGIGMRGTGTSNIGVLAESSTGTPLIATRNSSSTGATSDAILIRGTLSSGTAGTGFGSNLGIQANTNGGTNRDQARFAALWTDATDATRTSALAFYTANSASLAEKMRLTGVGALWIGRTSGGLTGAGDLDVFGNASIGSSGKSVGFYGVTPVARAAAITSPSGGATIDSQSRTAIDAIRVALTNIGITS